MGRTLLGLLLCAAVLVPFGCVEERVAEPPSSGPADVQDAYGDAEALAAAVATEAGWVADGEEAALPEAQSHGGQSPVVHFHRERITRDIAHYEAQVRVGPGPYDVIGIHRVVKETRPHRPIQTDEAIFLQHGASTDFTFCYLPGQYSRNVPDDFGFAVYLASNDIDVWGIDQRWCLVPPSETNFDFMATWDIPMHIADLGLGIRIAQFLRLMTGNDWDPMLLLGFSFGAELGFGVVDGEALLPDAQRSVRGFIPVDMVIKLPEDSPWRAWMCDIQPYYEDQIAAGIYGEGALFRPMGLLARDDPNGESPFFPGLSNHDAALALGTALLYGVPPFHLFEGIFEGEMTVGLQNLSTEAWIDLLCTMSYVESNVASLDQTREICGGDVPWNGNWGLVDIPVFYLTARGGFGDASLYQLGFLGSTDLTSLVVSSFPGDPERDFGHLDLFLTEPAQGLVWEPILQWIQAHPE